MSVRGRSLGYRIAIEPSWWAATDAGTKLVPAAAAAAGAAGPQAAAPQGSNGTITTPEDTLYVFSQTDFGYSDGDGNPFAGVFITTEPVNGALAYEGSAIGAGSFITAADIAAGKLEFEPNQNMSGSPYASFTFQVVDSTGVLDPSPNTITVNVTAVNDAPVYTNFNSGSAGTFNEGQANPIFIDSQGNGTVADIDSADFAGGFLRVSITQNGVPAEDRLGIANAGGVTVSGTAAGSTVSVGGIVIGTIAAGGTGIGEDLLVNFTASANAARAQSLIRALTYFNSNAEGPSQATRTLAVSLNDGDGAQLGTTNIIAGVMGFNDPAVLTDPTQSQVTYLPGEAPVALWAGVMVVDPDNQPNFQMGSFTMSGGGSGGVISLTGTRFILQNNAPSFIIDTTTNLEIGQANLNGGFVQVYNLTAAATNSVVNALIQSFGYSTQGANPGLGNFQASMSFFDGTSGGFGGGMTSNTIHQTITVANSGTAPLVDLNGSMMGNDSTMFYTEGGTPAALGNSLLVLDANGGNQLDRMIVTLFGALPEDVLTWGALPAGVTAAVTTPSGNRVVTFAGAATPLAYEALLAGIRYSNSSDAPVSQRSITVTVESEATPSAAAFATIFISQTDDLGTAQNDSYVSTATDSLFGNVGFENGFGADLDPDGTLDVVQVNGSAGNVGSEFVLASGARLLIQSFGSMSYNPNGAFAGNGGLDSFTYTLRGGSMATVTVFVTPAGVNTITGTPDPDVLASGSGDDILVGLAGNDYLYVNSAGDLIVENPGGGYDNVLASLTYTLNPGAHVEILSTDNHGGTGSINLTGNALGQVIIGNAGNNVIDGGGGSDRFAGLAGDDFYYVDSLDDFVDEGAGGGYDNLLCRVDYVLTNSAEIEVISTDNHGGTAGIDIRGSAFGQVIIGNAGSNVLDGGGGSDRLAGLGGNDFYYVDSLDDFVDETAGGGYDNLLCRNDYVLTGNAEIEVISTDSHSGTAAIDITGSAFGQIIIGNAGSNLLVGGGGSDRLAGLGGDDFLLVDSMDDFVDEEVGGGYDNLFCRSSYTLFGAAEIELISTDNHAGTAAIDITGSAYNQVILGNAGNNVLDGSFGADRLAGLGGIDSFKFTTNLGAFNIDVIDGFDADDTILLENAIFTGLAAGALNANAFVNGTAAADADDRIIYNSATGQLFFDADGNGSGAQIQFATIENHFALTAADFSVI